ncbi:hypothetical protein LSAT2_013434 [Lamellibrachia satsuma]|nr:hypothetical protein LSAT2_013434 [Lamellibrachia satsuma]
MNFKGAVVILIATVMICFAQSWLTSEDPAVVACEKACEDTEKECFAKCEEAPMCVRICRRYQLEERLIEQLIVGMRLSELQKELLAKDENLTLDEALNIGRTQEASTSHMSQLRGMLTGTGLPNTTSAKDTRDEVFTKLDIRLPNKGRGYTADLNVKIDTGKHIAAENFQTDVPGEINSVGLPQSWFRGKPKLGHFLGIYHIVIDLNVQPTIHAPRKCPIQMKDEIKSELQKMEEARVIRRVIGYRV